MNKLDILFYYIEDLRTQKSRPKIYHKYIKSTTKSKKIIGEQYKHVKTDILYDYINAYADRNIQKFQEIKTFEELVDNLNLTFSSIEQLNFNTDGVDHKFNILMHIVEKIYIYIDKNPELIDQYNYLLYIHLYKTFNVHKGDDQSKDKLYKFMIKSDRSYIKHKLILNLSSLIYLCCMTNFELGDQYNTAQYMILDYFYGICKIKNQCVPINQRQILISILNLTDNQDLIDKKIEDPVEKTFYNLYRAPFKEIQQYTFPGEHTDCGETTILNIFNYFLINNKGEFILPDTASDWDYKLKDFYKKYRTMESMTNISISILKQDLRNVLNSRPDKISLGTDGDINTDEQSMLDTCAFLLGVDSLENFITVFNILKPSINAKQENITRNNDTSITYKNAFILNLKISHAEFILINNNNIELIENENENSLNNHWITFNKYPLKYSFEHFIILIKNARNAYYFFARFPNDQQTENICIEAVKHDKRIINLIKEELLTVKVYVSALKYTDCDIPEEILTSDFYVKALNTDISIIRRIPKEKQTPDMIKIIQKNPDRINETEFFLFYINTELITQDLCILVFDKQPQSYMLIPDKFRTEKMYLFVFIHWYDKNIPVEILTDEFYYKALNENITVIKIIPKTKQNKKMIEIIQKNSDRISESHDFLSYINKELITQDLYDLVLKK